MRQIILILLFIFTLQKNIHNVHPKNDEPHKKDSSYRVAQNEECEPGYFKRCFIKGMYVRAKNIPKQCYCYEKKPQKILRILKDVRTTKTRTTTTKVKPTTSRTSRHTSRLPFRGKLEKVFPNYKKCNGDYYVCYSYPIQKMSRCHCSKHPY